LVLRKEVVGVFVLRFRAFHGKIHLLII
jgi:hypothetical protein